MNKFEICNLALMYIGVTRPIQSFSENSTEAQMCNRAYDKAKREVLKTFPWKFSKCISVLTVTTETNNKYEYVYEYPSDAIRILTISDKDGIGAGSQPFDVTTYVSSSIQYKRIITDIKDAYAEYILDADESIMSDEFITALAWKIASELGTGLSKTTQAMQIANQMYTIKLSEAQKAEMYEQDNKIENGPSYISSRGGWINGKF